MIQGYPALGLIIIAIMSLTLGLMYAINSIVKNKPDIFKTKLLS